MEGPCRLTRGAEAGAARLVSATSSDRCVRCGIGRTENLRGNKGGDGHRRTKALGTGRTTILQSVVDLVIFDAFLFPRDDAGRISSADTWSRNCIVSPARACASWTSHGRQARSSRLHVRQHRCRGDLVQGPPSITGRTRDVRRSHAAARLPKAGSVRTARPRP